MEQKIEHISQLVNSQDTNSVEVDHLRKHVIDKIDSMRKDLIRGIEDWVSTFKNNLFNDLGFDGLARTKQ